MGGHLSSRQIQRAAAPPHGGNSAALGSNTWHASRESVTLINRSPVGAQSHLFGLVLKFGERGWLRCHPHHLTTVQNCETSTSGIRKDLGNHRSPQGSQLSPFPRDFCLQWIDFVPAGYMEIFGKYL
ncbi:hypothetical protein TNCV_4537611 [Trichonephila clavipes]|nr:hypothetical protein TNCV_4537611 [Trichonephila clavipes]